MKGFSFRLKSLHQVRIAEQQNAENKVSEANGQIQFLKNKLKILIEKREVATQNYYVLLSKEDVFKEISLQTNYINSLIEQEKQLNQQITILNNLCELKRQELITAANKVKILDKLRENCLTDYLNEVSRSEQLFVDELAMFAFIRRSK
ncbi:MAG: flagellar export protein FliJ [Blastocatellia bacterium]